MQSFVWHVLSNAAVHKKLVVEVLHAPLSPVVQYKEAQSLPYFQACLKEAMRLQPAVGFNITRNVPVGGAELNGTWLPGGTQVAVNAWVMHRDKDVFGEDADHFNPERWLNAPEERVKLMERCMFQVSSLCILPLSARSVYHAFVTPAWQFSRDSTMLTCVVRGRFPYLYRSTSCRLRNE